MSQLIRKEGKARWVYRCDVCELTFVEVDQLRILEARNRHLRPGFSHLGNAFREALKPTRDLLETIASAFSLRQEDLELAPPPPRRPGDPGVPLLEQEVGGR